MSYPTGEALILTVLQSVAGFGGVNGQPNAACSDWGILNFGPNVAAVVVQDSAAIMPQSPVTFENHWRTIIQVWQFYVDEIRSTTDLQANVELVKTKFQVKRTLGDTTGSIIDSQVVSIEAPQEQWKRGQDGPEWISQNVIIEWIEQQQVTYA